jgi:hypothetical protein
VEKIRIEHPPVFVIQKPQRTAGFHERTDKELELE